MSGYKLGSPESIHEMEMVIECCEILARMFGRMAKAIDEQDGIIAEVKFR
jgi:hypothetical protein